MNVLTYEQLKQQLEAREREVMALTNECAALKMCALGWIELFADEVGDPHVTEDVLPKTPLTDAALAAVEARGVEKFADTIGAMYQHEKPATVRARTIKHIVFLATHYAKDLREAR